LCSLRDSTKATEHPPPPPRVPTRSVFLRISHEPCRRSVRTNVASGNNVISALWACWHARGPLEVSTSPGRQQNRVLSSSPFMRVFLVALSIDPGIILKWILGSVV
jgi:hypothetical protein